MRSTCFRTSLFALGAALLTLQSAVGQTPASVKGDRTNLRAKPGFDGEVLGSLKKGDVVTVLGEVDGLSADGKTPRPWSKVALPAQVPVWVFSPLLDSKTKMVKGVVVNLRAGPGKNYSTLGHLAHGSPVTIVRSLEDWTQIEPPADTFAYIASSLLETNAPAVAKTEAAPEKPAPVVEPKPAEPVPVPIETKVAEAPQLKPAATEPAPATAVPQPVPAVVPAPIATAPSIPATTAAPAATDAKTTPPAELKPRQVIRDGVVGNAISVQAPGYFELRSIRAEGVVDYLVSESKDLDLSKFNGKAVTVSGEEWRDIRWKTPVLKVKTIEAAF
jgi:uncharacterized protein YgiM (DUF1202 family)